MAHREFSKGVKQVAKTDNGMSQKELETLIEIAKTDIFAALSMAYCKGYARGSRKGG